MGHCYCWGFVFVNFADMGVFRRYGLMGQRVRMPPTWPTISSHGLIWWRNCRDLLIYSQMQVLMWDGLVKKRGMRGPPAGPWSIALLFKSEQAMSGMSLFLCLPTQWVTWQLSGVDFEIIKMPLFFSLNFKIFLLCPGLKILVLVSTVFHCCSVG